MNDITSQNFGFLIAYVLPGFTMLCGISYVSDTVKTWLGTTQADVPTVGGFLYVTLASVGAGLIASVVRWLVIDTLHHRTGIHRPSWDFSQLQRNIAAFNLVVEHQYRYYQFFSGTLVSLFIVYLARHLALGYPNGVLNRVDLILWCLVVLFFLGSRDTYRKYIERGEMMLGQGASGTMESSATSESFNKKNKFAVGSDDNKDIE